jgi:alpha-glucosidase/alpha-D-xyloside xylohydrolase
METRDLGNSDLQVLGLGPTNMAKIEKAGSRPQDFPMKRKYSRRQVLQTMGAASAAVLFPLKTVATPGSEVADQDVEIQITSISEHTFRLTILPVRAGQYASLPDDGSLIRRDWGRPLAQLSGKLAPQSVRSGELNINIADSPLSFTVSKTKAEFIKRFTFDRATGVLSFLTGDSPLLGLGEGGPQFDRRGSTDTMRSSQGGYELATHGGRVPIPWLIGTAGWAMFIHQRYCLAAGPKPDVLGRPAD